MKINKLTNRLYTMYGIVLIPLILFGLYKNGISLYIKGYVNLITALKPVIIIGMSLTGGIIGAIIRELRKTKKFDPEILKAIKGNIIESLLFAMILPIKSSPVIVLIISFLISLFSNKIKLNRVALAFLIVAIINHFLHLNIYQNIYEIENTLNYNSLDLFIGWGTGGICSSSILFSILGLIVLSFSKLYKKDLVISSLLTFVLISSIVNVIASNYINIFKVMFSYNVLFALIFISPNLYSSSYTTKGQVLSGVILGILSYVSVLFLNYNGVIISILFVNILDGVFDRIFVIK